MSIIGNPIMAGAQPKASINVTAKAGALLNLHYKDSSIILQSYQLGASETQHTFKVKVSETAYVIEDANEVSSVIVLVDSVASFNVEVFYVPRDGLIAEYLFANDDASTIHDTSGNGVHLVNMGATFVDALGGKGMQTAGASCVNAANLTKILPSTYEISLAVKFGTNRPDSSRAIDFYPIGVQRRWVILSYEANGLLIAVNNNEYRPVINPEETNFIFMGANTSQGWYQINDELLVTANDSPYTNASVNCGALGNNYGNSYAGKTYENYLPGFLAKMRVYNRQLTDKERTALYNYGYGI